MKFFKVGTVLKCKQTHNILVVSSEVNDNGYVALYKPDYFVATMKHADVDDYEAQQDKIAFAPAFYRGFGITAVTGEVFESEERARKAVNGMPIAFRWPATHTSWIIDDKTRYDL